MKKPVIAAIFAHPDDEAFGPGGTIRQLSEDHEVYLLCVTNGDGKMGNRKKEIALGKLRKKELQASAEILGVKKIFFLGYRDGSLNNNQYHDIAADLQKILKKIKPERLITYEPRGVSGHTDHIVVSNVTSFIFPKLSFVKSLWYYALIADRRSQIKDYFIHFPPGYSNDELDQVVDVSDVWEEKVKAMHCHKSQQQDVDRILHNQSKLPKKEYFITIDK